MSAYHHTRRTRRFNRRELRRGEKISQVHSFVMTYNAISCQLLLCGELKIADLGLGESLRTSSNSLIVHSQDSVLAVKMGSLSSKWYRRDHYESLERRMS